MSTWSFSLRYSWYASALSWAFISIWDWRLYFCWRASLLRSSSFYRWIRSSSSFFLSISFSMWASISYVITVRDNHSPNKLSNKKDNKNTYDLDLFPVLSFGDLRCTLLVEVCALDLVLQFSEFGALGAYFLQLPRLLLLVHLHSRHFTRQILFHQGQRDISVVAYQAGTVGHTEVLSSRLSSDRIGVGCGVSKSHLGTQILSF